MEYLLPIFESALINSTEIYIYIYDAYPIYNFVLIRPF